VSSTPFTIFKQDSSEPDKPLSRHVLNHFIGDSKASDRDIYKNFLARKNELISHMLSKAGPNAHDNSFYLRVLQKVNSALKESDEIMDQVTFQNMQKLIADEIKLEDKAVKAELNAFNEKLKDMNDSMLEGLQKHVDEDDRLLKYRFLQVFLLLTPIGAFSIAGSVFNYIDPLMELIGPLFEAGKTLGEGLGDMASSEVLGPLGKITEAFRIDEAIQLFFDETPIVNDVCEIFDFITDNDFVQNALGVASPLQSSPMALLGIAMAYSFFRADTEMTQYQKVSDYKKSHQKALEEIFKEFENDKNDKLEVRIKEFSEKKLSASKKANHDAKLVSFVSDEANADKLDDLFGELKFKIKDLVGNTVEQTMSEILKSSDKKKFSEILFDVNCDVKKEALDRFLLFSAIQDSKKPFSENLKEFKQERSLADKQELRNKSIKNLNSEFITESAIKLNLTTRKKLDEEMPEIAKLEKQLLDLDTKYLMDLARTKIPSGSVSNPRGMPLGGETSQGIAL